MVLKMLHSCYPAHQDLEALSEQAQLLGVHTTPHSNVRAYSYLTSQGHVCYWTEQSVEVTMSLPQKYIVIPLPAFETKSV